MNQLVQLVVERTGIGEDKAQKAVETVVGFLKERLPGGVGGQLDSIVGGQGGGGGLGDIASGLGGMMGGGTRT